MGAGTTTDRKDQPMPRGPRYVPRLYPRDRVWRVYDTWFQLPHTNTYQEFSDCKAAVDRMNRALEENQKRARKER